MADMVGKTLGGRFEIVELLGRGGMAEVYQAYQPSMERYIAVKVLMDHLANANTAARFRREAKAVGRLRHPHIIQVFDFGIENNIYYMAMEYIQGPTLKTHLDLQGKLSIAETLRIAEYMADALHYAHKAEIIHRDVKPSNIMFIDQTLQHPILTDFGIAFVPDTVALTKTNAVMGSLHYLAPEIALDQGFDGRADIYSLGILMFQLLTGNVPYEGRNPLEIMNKHVSESVPSLQAIDPATPTVVDLLMQKALQKEPRERFTDAGAFADAIRNTQRQLGITKLDADSKMTRPVNLSQKLGGTTPYVGSSVAPDEKTRQSANLQPKSSKIWVIVVGLVLLVLMVFAIIYGIM